MVTRRFENGGGGRSGFGGFGGFSSTDFSDIFEDFFGDFGGRGRGSSRRGNSNNRGSDLRYDLTITLEEAYLGKKQNIQFSTSENVIHVKEMDLSQVTIQIDVHIVVEMDELDQIKVFLLYNKHVHNVLAVERKLQIHAQIVMDKEINKQQKKYL